jgi:hypothetical protein
MLTKRRDVRLYITGGPGSGKTRAAREVAAALSVPVHGLDDVVWDNRDGHRDHRRPEAARDEAVRRIAAEPAWIVEGTYFQGWLRPILERADCVVILATPRRRRLVRLVRRHFLERSPLRHAGDNLRLFASNARWGFGYERTVVPELVRRLEAVRTPFVVHRGTDSASLIAEIERAHASPAGDEVAG